VLRQPPNTVPWVWVEPTRRRHYQGGNSGKRKGCHAKLFDMCLLRLPPRGGPEYMADATALGTALAQDGHQLVYGAGDVGLMGAVARAAQAAGVRPSA
jgi:predicted Rossmann-fold nucleotide-binding protein